MSAGAVPRRAALARRATAGGGDRVNGLGAAGAVAAVDDDRGSIAGRLHNGGAADAGCRAGHERF